MSMKIRRDRKEDWKGRKRRKSEEVSKTKISEEKGGGSAT